MWSRHPRCPMETCILLGVHGWKYQAHTTIHPHIPRRKPLLKEMETAGDRLENVVLWMYLELALGGLEKLDRAVANQRAARRPGKRWEGERQISRREQHQPHFPSTKDFPTTIKTTLSPPTFSSSRFFFYLTSFSSTFDTFFLPPFSFFAVSCPALSRQARFLFPAPYKVHFCDAHDHAFLSK